MRCISDDLVAAAESVTAAASAVGMECLPYRRGRWLWIVEGLWLGDRWIDVSESVRKRRPWSSTWVDVQPAEDAVRSLLAFLEERPDLHG